MNDLFKLIFVCENCVSAKAAFLRLAGCSHMERLPVVMVRIVDPIELSLGAESVTRRKHFGLSFPLSLSLLSTKPGPASQEFPSKT